MGFSGSDNKYPPEELHADPTGNRGEQTKPTVTKGCFEPMGGAERDLIKSFSPIERFIVSVATLRPSDELEEVCSDSVSTFFNRKSHG